MKLAILISGEVRTFVLKEQYLFFERLLIHLKQFYDLVDVFMILKIPGPNDDTNNYNIMNNINNKFIQSIHGLKYFEKIIKLLQPKYLHCFYDFKLNPGFTSFNIQLKMIDMCIDAALKYQSEHNISYYTFFRIRPDSCFLLNELDIINKQNCSIYTSIKSDAFANDQIIIINKYVLYTWWFKNVKKIVNSPMKVSPEYIIYNGYNKYLVSNFQNWIIRGYNNVINWDKMYLQKQQLSSEYVFQYMDDYNQMLILLPHTEFIEKIKKIPNIRLDTYITY